MLKTLNIINFFIILLNLYSFNELKNDISINLININLDSECELNNIIPDIPRMLVDIDYFNLISNEELCLSLFEKMSLKLIIMNYVINIFKIHYLNYSKSLHCNFHKYHLNHVF